MIEEARFRTRVLPIYVYTHTCVPRSLDTNCVHIRIRALLTQFCAYIMTHGGLVVYYILALDFSIISFLSSLGLNMKFSFQKCTLIYTIRVYDDVNANIMNVKQIYNNYCLII